MRIFRLVFVLLFVACSASTAPAAGAVHAQRLTRASRNKAATLCNQGAELYGRGKVDQAIALYRQALTLDPILPEALGDLGLALDSKGDYAGAIQELTEELKWKPNNPVARSNLGLALYHSAKYADSIAEYQKAIAASPSSRRTRTRSAIWARL